MDAVESPQVELAWLRNLASYWLWVHRTRPARASGRVYTGDISIYYQSCGSGEPVMMLHGGFSSADTWAPQVVALAPHYHTVAIDSRGHGRTTLGRLSLTYRQMARDAVTLIESLDLGPVHLVGWSDGGCTALAVAMERPELLRSMTLLGTSYNTDNYSADAWRAIDDFLRPTAAELLVVRAMRYLMSPEPWDGSAFVERMTEMWMTLPDFTLEDLRRIETPTLVIGCDRDKFLSHEGDPLSVFRATAEAMPNATLEVITGGSHSVSILRPSEVNSLILDFLTQCKTGSAR